MIDPNNDIVPTLRMFDGLMMNIAADEIEMLRARVKDLEARAAAHAQPIGEDDLTDEQHNALEENINRAFRELASANARLTALESERDALLAAAGKEAVLGEPAAWAVYWGIGEMRPNSVHFEKQTATNVAAEIKSNTEIRTLYTAPTAALENGDGRDAIKNAVDLLNNLADRQELAGFPLTAASTRHTAKELDAVLSQKAGE